MSKSILPDSVISKLLEQGEWWYVLSLFSDKDLKAVMQQMDIGVSDNDSRTVVVAALSNRVMESGVYIDVLRDYFFNKFLLPNEIHKSQSEIWYNFEDCESLLYERLATYTFSPDVSLEKHKRTVLEALTRQHLATLVDLFDGTTTIDSPQLNILRNKAIEGLMFCDIGSKAVEICGLKLPEHLAILEILFGAKVIEEDYSNDEEFEFEDNDNEI